MTIRQKILKAIYPVWLGIASLTGKNKSILENDKSVKPGQDLYSLSVKLTNGDSLSLTSLKGQKILIVNTASDCGYTGQYEALVELYEKYGYKLAIVAFPANDFKEQEKGTDEEIAEFCKLNYGVKFPIAAKSQVIRGSSQNPVFQWLTDKSKNGWNDQQPIWNFSKYLINEEGVLTHYFDPAISPLSEEVLQAINH